MSPDYPVPQLLMQQPSSSPESHMGKPDRSQDRVKFAQILLREQPVQGKMWEELG